MHAHLQMLTWKDVAKLMQVSVRTLERMVEAREFPTPIKVRGGDRWTVKDVEQWQERRRWLADAGQITTNAGQVPTNDDTTEEPPSNPKKPR